VQLFAAEQKEVDLMPPAARVAELEVRPGAKRRLVRHDRSDERQALGLVRKL